MFMEGANYAWADAGDVTTNVNLTFDGTATFANPYTYTKGAEEVLSSASGQAWNDGGNPKTLGLVLNGDKQLQMSNGNMTIVFAGESAGDKDVVNVSFDLAYPYVYNSSTDRILQFVISAGETAVVTEAFNFNKGTIPTSTMGMTTEYLYRNGSTTLWSNKVHFEITFNYETKKISMTTACTAATKTSGAFEIDMPENTGAITKFYISMGSANANAGRYALFDNLLVQTTEGDYSTTKTITYAYKDQDENDITDVVVAKGGTASATPETGDTYTPIYLSSFVDDDWAYDYTYVSGGDAFEVTTDATITLVYTKSAHATTDVAIKYKNGDDVLKEDLVAEGYPVGKDIDYAVRKYVLSNGTLYQTASGTQRTVAATATIEESVSSTGISNVVFFSEGEECSNRTGVVASTVASFRQVGRFNGDKVICTLGAGKYQISTLIHVGNGSDTSVDFGTATFKAGDATVGTKTVKNKTNNQSYTSDEFPLTANTDITLDFNGSNATGVDYIYIVQTGVSITPAYTNTTYVTPYALDFTSVDGLKAYVATAATGGNVTFSEVEAAVPAGTPLLLIGTAGTAYSVPVAASASAPAVNMLRAGDGSTEFTGSTWDYILFSDGLFYKIGEGTVATDKAYLHCDSDPTGSNARPLTIEFNDKATGINTVKGEVVKGSEIYNLQGQRIVQPSKGLYIMNGKKVIIK